MTLFSKNIRRSMMVLLLLALSIDAYAKAHFVASIGYDLGGDRLVTTVFTDGSTGKIDANQGLFLGLGGSYRFGEDTGFEIMATYNYKFQLNTASNGDVSFDVESLEALILYNFKSFNIGVGTTHQYSPKVSGSGVASGIDFTYDDAQGTLAQIGWRISRNATIGVRYTEIEYKGTGLYNKSGNSIGLYATAEF